MHRRHTPQTTRIHSHLCNGSAGNIEADLSYTANNDRGHPKTDRGQPQQCLRASVSGRSVCAALLTASFCWRSPSA